MLSESDLPNCSFCGKPASEVLKLVAGAGTGPGTYICDSCINVCKGILDKELLAESQKAVVINPPKPMSTRDIKERLDLLRQLRDDKTITATDYQLRVKQLLARI